MLKVSGQYLDEILSTHGVRNTGTQGKVSGDSNVPPIIREVIGKIAVIDSPSNVARAFNVSEASASNYSNGHVNHGDGKLAERIDSFVEKAQEQAASKLLHALGVITPEEVEAAPLKTKLEVVDRFAGVVSKLRPRFVDPMIRDSNVVIYRPAMKKEEDYESMEIV